MNWLKTNWKLILSALLWSTAIIGGGYLGWQKVDNWKLAPTLAVFDLSAVIADEQKRITDAYFLTIGGMSEEETQKRMDDYLRRVRFTVDQIAQNENLLVLDSQAVIGSSGGAVDITQSVRRIMSEPGR